MKSAILLITLLCCTSAGWAQSHTFGLRLSYFTGRYSYPVSSIYHYGVWKEQPEGLEVALQYRLALGQSPLYVQTEVGYYNRRIDGSAQEPVLDAPRVVLKGQQSLLLLPLMVGGRMGRGKLHGFIAGGVNLGFFLKKDWEEVRYRDDEAIMKIGSGEFGVLMEGGLDYDLGKHFQVSVNYRYSTVQHSTFIRSLYPLESSNWFVKRKGPGLALGWRI